MNIKALISDLNNLHDNLHQCRLAKDKRFNGIPEYMLYTIFSYCGLEAAYQDLENIIK